MLVRILQNRFKTVKMKKIRIKNLERGDSMNFFNPKTRKAMAVVILVLVVTMVASSVIPYLV